MSKVIKKRHIAALARLKIGEATAHELGGIRPRTLLRRGMIEFVGWVKKPKTRAGHGCPVYKISDRGNSVLSDYLTLGAIRQVPVLPPTMADYTLDNNDEVVSIVGDIEE